MRTPPRLATFLLHRLGEGNDALAGDLDEEYRAGRSRSWYWRQVCAAIVLGTLRMAGVAPLRTMAGVASGWLTLLLFFLAMGDATADAVSGWLFQWERVHAYATQIWWPFQIVGVAVSYVGFALAGIAVARTQGSHAGPVLMAYTVSIFLGLLSAAAVVAYLSWHYGSIRAPHALFYVVSVALPYQWRSGLLLAPAVTLLAGLLACPRRAVLPASKA
jgi:hypothetical protein